MAGETRIIAFGASGAEQTGGEAGLQPLDASSTLVSDSHEQAEGVPDWDSEEPAPLHSWTDRLAPIMALVAIFAWTAFFVWSQWSTLPATAPAQIPALIVQWTVPILLVALGRACAAGLAPEDAAGGLRLVRQIRTTCMTKPGWQ